VPVDRNSLPKDPEILQQMLVDLTTQLDKTQRLLSQLLAAKSGTHSEQLSADQLRLFVQELNAPESEAATEAQKDDDLPPGSFARGLQRLHPARLVRILGRRLCCAIRPACLKIKVVIAGAFGNCIRPTSAVCFGPPLSC
jgi:hypothetical protein